MNGFAKHDLMTLSAALAFYTALSIAPLLIILLAVVGLLGENSQNDLIRQIEDLIGQQAASAISAIIQSANDRPNQNGLAGVGGGIFLLFSASGVFAQLQASLNVIWETQNEVSLTAWSWIRKRLFSMGMVLTLGFLAMVSLIVSAVLGFLFSQQGSNWRLAHEVISILIFAFLFSSVFKYLPDRPLSWRHALVGGFSTALLFVFGKSLIGIYLAQSAVGSAYGAAGSLIVFLAWIYYSSIIIFTGAEITRITSAHSRLNF